MRCKNWTGYKKGWGDAKRQSFRNSKPICIMMFMVPFLSKQANFLISSPPHDYTAIKYWLRFLKIYINNIFCFINLLLWISDTQVTFCYFEMVVKEPRLVKYYVSTGREKAKGQKGCTSESGPALLPMCSVTKDPAVGASGLHSSYIKHRCA